MHINNLLRGKSVPPTHSNFLDENSDESGWSPNPDINEFISHIANRDFAAALKIISGKTNVDTSVFLMPAFKHYPVEAQEFLDFWKSNLAPQTHSENIGTESFDDLEFSLNFNGYTYRADFEENPRVRLNELHLPKSPSFYKWFGDSKVVDDQGRPLVVYHATSSEEEFSDIKAFSHFGTLDAASSIVPTGGMTSTYSKWPKSRILPTYLKIESPLEVHDIDDKHNPIIWLYLMADAGIIDRHIPQDLVDNWKTGYKTYDREIIDDIQDQWKVVIQLMDENGYDGFVYMNAVEDEGSWSWVPIRSNQIVSALDAQGTRFEPEDESQPDLFNEPGDIIPVSGDDVTPTKATRWYHYDQPTTGYQAKRSDYYRDEDPDDYDFEDDIQPMKFVGYPGSVSPSKAVALPEARSIVPLGEIIMNEYTMGGWGSGWYQPFTDSSISDQYTHHVSLIEKNPEVFGWEPEYVQGKSEEELMQLYIPLIDHGWIRYYWASTTIVINGLKTSLKKAQEQGFIKKVFSQRTPKMISFEVSDGDAAQFTLPHDTERLARFLVTFTESAYNKYGRKKEINEWEDIELFPEDEEIF